MKKKVCVVEGLGLPSLSGSLLLDSTIHIEKKRWIVVR